MTASAVASLFLLFLQIIAATVKIVDVEVFKIWGYSRSRFGPDVLNSALNACFRYTSNMSRFVF